MAKVMIRCPVTNVNIYTMLSMDKASWERSNLDGVSIKCRQCGQTHTYNKRDTWLED